MKPAPSYVERRAFGRRETNIKATVRAGSCMHVCTIRDLSEGGALLEFEQAVSLPMLIWLRWEDVPSEIICEVRRQQGNRAGVQFSRPITLSARHATPSAEPAARVVPPPAPTPIREPIGQTLTRAADLVAKHRSAMRGAGGPASSPVVVPAADKPVPTNRRSTRTEPAASGDAWLAKLSRPAAAPSETAPPPLPALKAAEIEADAQFVAMMAEVAAAAGSDAAAVDSAIENASPPPSDAATPKTAEAEHARVLSDAPEASKSEPAAPLGAAAMTTAASASSAPDAVRFETRLAALSTGPIRLETHWPPSATPVVVATVKAMSLKSDSPAPLPVDEVGVEPAPAALCEPERTPMSPPPSAIDVPDWLLPWPPAPLPARAYRRAMHAVPMPLSASAYAAR